MTRLWGVDPEILCREHLLGEHKEMHQEVGTLRKHPHGQAIVEGHAERQQVDTSLLQRRHDDLVSEMNRRGMNHDSPMDYTDERDLGEIDKEANLSELIDRCDKCKKRYENKKRQSVEGENR